LYGAMVWVLFNRRLPGITQDLIGSPTWPRSAPYKGPIRGPGQS